jgi:uncharacterized protein (TIGR00251 family)
MRRAAGNDTAGVTLSVKVQPRASKNAVLSQSDGTFKVRLTAPPVDGAANEALVEFLAGTLDVSRSQVEILSGHTGRQKIVKVRGISEEDLRRVLNEAGK